VNPLEILVVDDDVNGRKALMTALRGQGHSCREAGDAEEARRKLKTQHADVVLCDWEMPGTSGLDLCRQTRAENADGPYTYFILMTGHDDPRRLLGAMKAGADDYQRKPIDLDELEARLVLAGRVSALHRQLGERAARLRRDSQRLYIASHTDALTGVGSRLALEEKLEAVRSEHARYGRRASLAVCDVDFFKSYNDHFGHVAGDEALRRVAQSIHEHLRASDRVYRYGGEEFVVLLPEQNLDEAARAIDRVRREVERLHIEAATPLAYLTISAGVAELDRDDVSATEWLKRADGALYRAKAGGRNCVAAGR
jgi:diguanylate cyclase (GGDEF)-like protein